MIEHLSEVALYALAARGVGEGRRHDVRSYDRFSSLVAQYHRLEIAAVAQLVEQKLEALVAEATGGEHA